MVLYFTFGNTHNTLRAERCLRRQGLAFAIVSKPPALRGPCGLAIRLAADLREPALQCLQKEKVPPRQELQEAAENAIP